LVHDCGEGEAAEIGKILEGQEKNLQYPCGLNQREEKRIEGRPWQDLKAELNDTAASSNAFSTE
jgi:hypothetical protein